jgi:polysaccharide chain length determinant protein (PEP-CTERM system associated)
MYLKYDLSINDYLNIFKRKIFTILAFSATIFIIAFFTILFLPSVYESSATILIESKTISGSDKPGWAPKKDDMTARFEALNAMLLTNEKMLAIAKKYELFVDKKKKVLTSQEESFVAAQVRGQIKTKLIKAETGSVYQAKQALAVQISAQFDNPEDTYGITKDIVNAFVNETSKSSKDKAIDTSTFFDKDANEKKKILEKIENELIAYKKSHAGMLPQNIPLQVGSLERLEADLRASQKEQAVARSELSSLEVELASARAGTNKKIVNESRFSSYKDEVDKLNANLSKLKTLYSDNHPAVKSLTRKISALRQLEETESNNEESVTEKSLDVAKVQAKIDAVNRRIRAMEREEAQIRTRMNRTENMVFQSAQTEGVLSSLERKHKSANLAYKDAKKKQDKARLDKDIELQDKGERFVVTEPPFMPTYPVKPNRKLLLLASLLLSAIGGLILAVVLEFLDKRLRGHEAITHTMKMQPLAFIPYIKNTEDAVNVRYKAINLTFYIMSIITLCFVYIHFKVIPMNEFITKILEKI